MTLEIPHHVFDTALCLICQLEKFELETIPARFENVEGSGNHGWIHFICLKMPCPICLKPLKDSKGIRPVQVQVLDMNMGEAFAHIECAPDSSVAGTYSIIT